MAITPDNDPPPDPSAEPAGYVVVVGPGDRVHFHDWGGPIERTRPGVLLLHGLSQTAWIWAPVARRLRTAVGTVAMDLRGLDEPPEVLRSLAAYLADRKGFDPSSWDADQRRAAEATVVETHAGRVVPSTRPHALEASVRTMFRYDPIESLVAVVAPVLALRAGEDDDASRSSALAAVSAARTVAGRTPIATMGFEGTGHNLMRYRPREVTAAILSLAPPSA
jgi:pimeloyl-ACP methyl ester carboxylesterase